jgi:hypothetical protein
VADRRSRPRSRCNRFGCTIAAICALGGWVACDRGADLASPIPFEERFVDRGDGSLFDRQLDLVWATRDNEESLNWYDAQSWIESYEAGGHSDWRLPTLDEIESLYDASLPGYTPGCTRTQLRVRIPAAFRLSCGLFWTSEDADRQAWNFNFFYGKRLLVAKRDIYGEGSYVLPVRSD